jgi:hypothetical protein
LIAKVGALEYGVPNSHPWQPFCLVEVYVYIDIYLGAFWVIFSKELGGVKLDLVEKDVISGGGVVEEADEMKM